MSDDRPLLPPTRLNDAELVVQMQAAQGGDQKAYAELLKLIAPWLRGYVRKHRRFLQAADVEDLVQEVLLSLHAVRQTYDPGRPFLPWFLAITHNRLADAARRHGRRSAGELAVDGVAVTFGAESTNTEDADRGSSQALQQAIRALPAGQRAAIELTKLRDMSVKEAAGELGTSVGAIKVAVPRAMLRLKRMLAGRTVKE